MSLAACVGAAVLLCFVAATSKVMMKMMVKMMVKMMKMMTSNDDEYHDQTCRF